MSIYLPNGYRIAWNCNSVVDEEVAKELAQNWADKTGRTFYVPDLGMFGPAGEPIDPDPDPGPSFDPLVVGQPTISGEPVVGYTLTCSEPSIQGGSGDVTVNYYWQDANNKRVLYMGGPHEVTDLDLTRTMCCQVFVADNKTGENTTVESTNCLGPVVRPVLDGYDFFVDGVLHDQQSQLGLAPGASVIFEVKPKGDVAVQPKDVSFAWSIRTGTGRLSGDTDKAAVVYIANDTAPSAALVQCQYGSLHADDVGTAAAEVLVSN